MRCATTGAPSRCVPRPSLRALAKRRTAAFHLPGVHRPGRSPPGGRPLLRIARGDPQEGDEPFRNFTSFAILPEAETKRYKPEEVPFTSRNWDNRITEYFLLSDRLGLRTCGVWGGWSSKPPYKPEAPSIELCQKLGMGVLTGTPIAIH